jgi:hypothetical protein
VLFFFEAGFFVLAVGTLVVAEAWGRGLALGLWSCAMASSLVCSALVSVRSGRRPPLDPAEQRWRETLAASWRHFNLLLGLGLLGLGLWWRLAP